MKYTFYWRNGDRDVFEGDAPEDALSKAGYGQGAVSALDFYAEGDDNSYIWFDHKWVSINSYVTVHALENDK